MTTKRCFISCLMLAGLATSASALDGEEANANVFKDCADCPEMVVVPAGSVTIGSHADEAYRRASERPKQDVRIARPFALAKTETTLGIYRQFVAETGHEQEPAFRDDEELVGCNYFDGKGYGYVAAHSWQNPGFPQREDEPVVCVSWTDASAFAEWISKKTGRTYRIPSSVEFEYAMRAGSQTPWAWGTDPSGACEFANIGDRTFAAAYPNRQSFNCDDGYVYPTAVASYQANAFGLHDLLGNAWEWTNDCWHTDLADAPRDGSSWLSEDEGNCEARTPKGGGWISGPGWARASARSADGARYRSFMLGFRLAADLD